MKYNIFTALMAVILFAIVALLNNDVVMGAVAGIFYLVMVIYLEVSSH